MATTLAYQSESPSGRAGDLAARVRRFVRFGLVGMSGVIVNEAALALLVDVFHTNYLLGALIATQCSTLWNFALVEWWAFDGAAGASGRLRRFVMFWAVNMVALALRGPILALLTSVFHIHYLISNLISLGVLVVLRFAIADSLIWGAKPAETANEPVAPDEVLTHFPHDLVEDLGWALNPVAEAAELVGDPHASAPSRPSVEAADTVTSRSPIEGEAPPRPAKKSGASRTSMYGTIRPRRNS